MWEVEITIFKVSAAETLVLTAGGSYLVNGIIQKMLWISTYIYFETYNILFSKLINSFTLSPLTLLVWVGRKHLVFFC